MFLRCPQFFRFKKEQPVLILDIGSEAVKALIFKKEEGKIILLGRSLQYLDPFRAWDPPIKIQDGKDSRKFEFKVAQEFILKAIKEAQDTAGEKVKDAFITLSPFIFKVFLKTVDIKRESNSQHISKQEERDIFGTGADKVKDLVAAEMSENYGLGRDELCFISLERIKLTIDGYGVPSLRGFRGRDIRLTYLVSAVPRSYITNGGAPIFLAGIRCRFKGFLHQASYFAHPAFSYQDGVYLDIGGRTTEVFVVRDKVLSLVGQIGIGGADFTEIIAKDLGLDLTGAKELKERYAARQLSPDMNLKLKEKFMPLISEWIPEVAAYLENMSGPLPAVFFLFGGGALLPEFKRTLEQGLPNVSLAGIPKVNLLLPKDLPGIESRNVLTGSPQETPALLLSYLI